MEGGGSGNKEIMILGGGDAERGERSTEAGIRERGEGSNAYRGKAGRSLFAFLE
jgi:hypothetical protein